MSPGLCIWDPGQECTGMYSAHLPRKLSNSLETNLESVYQAQGLAGIQVAPIPGGFATRENLGLSLCSATYFPGDWVSYITSPPLGLLSVKER